MIDQDRLKSILDYDPETGIFNWVCSGNSRMKAGDIAGHLDVTGYIKIRIDRKQRLAHRLAFIWMTGACPKFVDHINRVRDDNRWENLRPATHQQNMQNRRSSKTSSSKYLGVSWCKRRGKWQAFISINRKNKHLGDFAAEIEAARAYDIVAAKFHEQFANPNQRRTAMQQAD